MTDRDVHEDCKRWLQKARSALLELPPTETEHDLLKHLDECGKCRAEVGELFRADRSLLQAFKALKDFLPSAPQDRIESILREARKRPDAACLLRKIRRPVNTILWIVVMSLSVVSLAVLAWVVYWSVKTGKLF